VRILALALALLLAGADGARASCRLALALAIDISSSVSGKDYSIQKDGLAAALRAPEVIEALLTQDGEVRIAVYEWSGWQQQDLVVGWTAVRAPEDALAISARVRSHVRQYREFSTAIGPALAYGAALLGRPEAAGCARRVIDVSGDGAHNQSETPASVRARGVLAGITVNGLVISGEWPDPVAYYRREVVGGPGAFLMVARNGFEDYPELIKGKLLREIKPPQLLGSAAPVSR
jgi:hypothetical protein